MNIKRRVTLLEKDIIYLEQKIDTLEEEFCKFKTINKEYKNKLNELTEDVETLKLEQMFKSVQEIVELFKNNLNKIEEDKKRIKVTKKNTTKTETKSTKQTQKENK